MKRISPRPRSFPPSTRRALPSSSPTSSVLRPRPTPRGVLRGLRLCAFPPRPVVHHRRRDHPRGLPAPVGVDCVRAELSDPGRSRRSKPTLFGSLPWPSACENCVGSDEFVSFGALSPGPPTRPPTLRPAGHPTTRKGWPSRGWAPPGVRLAQIAVFLRSLTTSNRFVPAHSHVHLHVSRGRLAS